MSEYVITGATVAGLGDVPCDAVLKVEHQKPHGIGQAKVTLQVSSRGFSAGNLTVSLPDGRTIRFKHLIIRELMLTGEALPTLADGGQVVWWESADGSDVPVVKELL